MNFFYLQVIIWVTLVILFCAYVVFAILGNKKSLADSKKGLPERTDINEQQKLNFIKSLLETRTRMYLIRCKIAVCSAILVVFLSAIEYDSFHTKSIVPLLLVAVYVGIAIHDFRYLNEGE